MASISDGAIQKALKFIDGLATDDRTSYYEIYENDPNERKEFPQSQYLLYVTFNEIGLQELSSKIASRYDFSAVDTVDPNRAGRPANDCFCVLEGKIEPFRHAGKRDCKNNDEKALLSIYWLQRKDRLRGWLYRGYADDVWRQLAAKYDPSRSVLEMDCADQKKQLYSVFKVALFGILAGKMGETELLASVRTRLRDWQDESGGWKTDRTIDLQPQGYANLETTALSILALVDRLEPRTR